MFYSIPSIYLSESAAATGIAVVTSMGAAASPSLPGFIQASTGSLSLGLVISSGIVLLAVVVLLVGVKAKNLNEKH